MGKSNTSYYDLLDELDKIDLDDSRSIATYAPEVPKNIRLFLGRLSMLQEVPYHYLVPDARLVNIRKENNKEYGALRFFCLDPLWVQSLLSGALSIGEDYEASFLLKKAMAGNYIAEVFQEETIKRLKDQLSGAYTPEDLKKEILNRLNSKQEYKLEDLDKISEPTVSQSNWRYTGFLLRSSIVAGLKGLEVVANGIDKKDSTKVRKLSVLRIEYISDDTLFCLCEGIITEVVITQPPENLYFGFNESNGAHYKMVDKKEVKINKRDNGKRVVRITGNDGLVEELKKKTGKAIEPANMAECLLSQPIKHTVSINWVEKTK